MVLSLHALPESKSSVPSMVMGVHTGYNSSSREPDILLVFVGTRHTCGALTCIQANTHKIKKKRERESTPSLEPPHSQDSFSLFLNKSALALFQNQQLSRIQPIA